MFSLCAGHSKVAANANDVQNTVTGVSGKVCLIQALISTANPLYFMSLSKPLNDTLSPGRTLSINGLLQKISSDDVNASWEMAHQARQLLTRRPKSLTLLPTPRP